MKGITSSLRDLNLFARLHLGPSQISAHRRVDKLYVVLDRYLPYSVSSCKRRDVIEFRDTFGGTNWTAILRDGKKILKMDSHVNEIRTKLALAFPKDNIFGRLKKSGNASSYLINVFKHLLNIDNDSAVHWPGMTTLLLAKAIGNPFASDNFLSKTLEDAIWSSQVELADIINTVHRNLIFNDEYHRCTPPKSRNTIPSRNDISQLVNDYFHSSVLYRIGRLNNYKVAWMIACVLESVAEARYAKSSIFVPSQIIRTLDDWEHRTFHPRGLLLASGCQASLELSGHGQKNQLIGNEFGKYFVLALKAHADIQQFVRYEKSISSFFELGSLPVVLHLEKNPETLAYIYSCGDTLDNLDYFVLHSAVVSSTGLHEARELLNAYIQKIIDHLGTFDETDAILYLKHMVEDLKNTELKNLLPF